MFFHPAFERKSIQASAWTQQATGAAVGFHPGRSKESAFEIMRVYLEAGGKADRAILCHSESEIILSGPGQSKIFNNYFLPQEHLTHWKTWVTLPSWEQSSSSTCLVSSLAAVHISQRLAENRHDSTLDQGRRKDWQNLGKLWHSHQAQFGE